MAIGTKLTAVMEACRYMPKDAENSFQHYRYTTAAGMFAKINEALTSQCLFTATELSLVDFRDVTNAKGNAEKHAVVSAKVTITDSETGETVTFTGLGSGQDASDKSIMKANTAALKYAYIGGLCIAMSDDPESDSGNTYQPPTPPAPKNQPNGNSNGGNADIVGKCEKCGKAVTAKVAEYSQKQFGKRLCYNCQNELKGNNGNKNPF